MLGSSSGLQSVASESLTPNQVRLDRLIALSKEQTDILDNVLVELEKNNKRLAIIGDALLKLLDAKAVDKKPVDKVVKVK